MRPAYPHLERLVGTTGWTGWNGTEGLGADGGRREQSLSIIGTDWTLVLLSLALDLDNGGRHVNTNLNPTRVFEIRN